MKPTNKERLNQETQAVHDRLERYLESSMKSEAQVARAIGRSQTALNQYRHNVYNVSEEKIRTFNNIIIQFLNREVVRKRKKVVGYCPTSIGEEIQAALHRCHIRGDMGIIIGTPGRGKTKSVQHYTSQNPEVIFLTANKGWSSRSVLSELLEVLKQSGYGNPYVATKRVIGALEGTDRIIIVDEAQFLDIRALEIVRSIHDATGVGVVYIGQPYLRDRFKGNEKELYFQILDRFSVIVRLDDDVYVEDVDLIAKSHGVMNAAAIKYLHKQINNRYGSFRVIEQLVDLARDATNKEAEALTAGDLRAVEHLMIM